MVREPAKRKTDDGGRRRINKFDGKLADYSAIKSSSGIVIPEVKKVLLDRKKIDRERASHRTNIIYPSEMARSEWCPRATYYRMSGLPEPSGRSSFTLENVFAEGNAIHTKWQSWLSETGKLWGDWRCTRCAEYVKDSLKPDDIHFGSCVGVQWVNLNKRSTFGFTQGQLIEEVPLATQFEHDWKYKEVTLRSKSLPISGHADGALTEHNCLIELKSVGVGTLKFEAPNLIDENTYDINSKKIIDIDGLWKNLHRPLLSHVKQGNIYLWMAKEMGLPFDSIVFLYEFKANQQIKEFRIHASEDILKPLLDMADQVRYDLEVGRPTICPFGGCSSCKSYEEDK